MAVVSADATGAYAALRTSVLDAGLLERARSYYAWRLGVSCLILAAGVALLVIRPPLTLLPAAVLIALGSVQVALVGHDAGHLAVFANRRANAILGYLCWSLTVGVSFRYWNDRHTRHHASPNHLARDPDVQWSYGPSAGSAAGLHLPYRRLALRHPRAARSTAPRRSVSYSASACWPGCSPRSSTVGAGC